MKKLLVAFLFSLVTFCSTAQEVIVSYAIEIGYWNDYTEEWEWTPKKNAVITFLLQGDMIIADDAARSTYYTYNTIVSDDYVACWQAIDENRKDCAVGIKVNAYSNYLIVIYPGICYRYTW